MPRVGGRARAVAPRALARKMAPDTDAVRAELRAAVRQLSDRGLRRSAKWAAEQLVGLAPAASDDHAMEMASPHAGEATAIDAAEADMVLLAKAYFDVNEFKRAAHALRAARGSSAKFLRWCAPARASFAALTAPRRARRRPQHPARAAGCHARRYSLYLAGEKRKEEELVEDGAAAVSGAVPAVSVRSRVANEQLSQILAEIGPEAEAGRLDGFGHYIHALVLREEQQPARATESLIKAIAGYPCLWSAWLDLAALNPGVEAADALVPPPPPTHHLHRRA